MHHSLPPDTGTRTVRHVHKQNEANGACMNDHRSARLPSFPTPLSRNKRPPSRTALPSKSFMSSRSFIAPTLEEGSCTKYDPPIFLQDDIPTFTRSCLHTPAYQWKEHTTYTSGKKLHIRRYLSAAHSRLKQSVLYTHRMPQNEHQNTLNDGAKPNGNQRPIDQGWTGPNIFAVQLKRHQGMCDPQWQKAS